MDTQLCKVKSIKVVNGFIKGLNMYKVTGNILDGE